MRQSSNRWGVQAWVLEGICVLAVVLLSCSSHQVIQEDLVPASVEAKLGHTSVGTAPTRIIVMIGDGMSVASLTAATYSKGEPLHILSMPELGYLTNHEYEYITTDSAASATALATGRKTHFEGVSVKPGTIEENEEDSRRHLKTVVEYAQEKSWRTGLVSTTRINHATPAAFAAHRHHRESYESIAWDMSRSGVDVLLGAGSRYFDQRADGLNLFEEMRQSGYNIARSADELREVSKIDTRVVGLLHERDMPYVGTNSRAMSLSEMTETAIEMLERDNEQGFFLMVEGGLIDWGLHDLEGVVAVEETLDFDEAVASALAYARERDDTLVIVVSDHETGAMSVLDPPYVQRYVDVLEGIEGGAGVPDFHPAAQHIYMGSSGSLIGGDDGSREFSYTFGPQEVLDRRLSLVFGHFSVASLPYWKKDGPFSAAHSITLIPVFAEGPGANYVTSVGDNALLGARIIELVRKGEYSDDVRDFPTTVERKRPQNVIVMIGDGMGINAVAAAYYVHGSLSMLGLPIKGMVATHGTDRLVNDSAATATALATGQRTRSGSVGVVYEDDDVIVAETVLERAESQGIRTGLVSTTSLTHATPAAFYAHHPRRKDEREISRYFVDLSERIEGADGIDIAIAGGKGYFDDESLERLRERGVDVGFEWDDTANRLPLPSLRLLGERGMNPASERLANVDNGPTLAQMTRVAIESLAGSDEGFFLMVEGGQIDWALHRLERGQALIDEIVDFDLAVAEAVEFAQADGNTLVIVTADHDHAFSVQDNHYGFHDSSCGVASICGGPYELEFLPVAYEQIYAGEEIEARRKLKGAYAPASIFMQYAWIVQIAHDATEIAGPHAANFVPLFALGPWADRFKGFMDQPDVGQLLLDWAGSSAREK